VKKLFFSIVAVLALVGCSQSINLEEHFSLNGTVEPLEAVNQNGKTVKMFDYKDKVWLSTFIFTNCDTVCSPMTAHIATLQEQLQDEKVDVEFVSFSIDPEYDSLEGSNQFVHSTSIYLIKGNTILEQYDAVSEVPYEKIVEDIKLLQ
jgi:protein SCO1/2